MEQSDHLALCVHPAMSATATETKRVQMPKKATYRHHRTVTIYQHKQKYALSWVVVVAAAITSVGGLEGADGVVVV
jgi:hypothetical protein